MFAAACTRRRGFLARSEKSSGKNLSIRSTFICGNLFRQSVVFRHFLRAPLIADPFAKLPLKFLLSENAPRPIARERRTHRL